MPREKADPEELWSVDPALLTILRSPGTNAALQLEDDSLAGPAGQDFPVVHGIPILLDDPALRADATIGLADSHRSTVPGDRSRTESEDSMHAIVRAFRSRAGSYYADNYEQERNLAREHRQQLVASLLKTHFVPGGLVLEAGSGPAVLGSEILALTKRYVAVDLSPHNLIEGRARVGPCSAVCASVTALPFADHTFDAVSAVGCLEYIRPLSVAVAELFRVAKPGAPLILTFANRASPARWWDEWIVLPVKRLRDRRRGRPVYRRQLTLVSEVHELVEATGGKVTTTVRFNQGVLGYPASSLALSQQLWRSLTTRLPFVLRFGSEFVIVAHASDPRNPTRQN
jgi:SAM-dependent methyltransferase/uncharacterized protein YbaR (Trm112 family)